MAETVKLGKVSMTLGGEYNPSQSYDKLTCVYYNQSSWMSRKEVPEGVIPSEENSAFWQKVSDRGAKGDTGPRGEVGPTGERGPQGNSGYQGASGELEVVNDLTSGGEASALSAEQGKILDGKLTELSEETSAKFESTAKLVAERFECVDTEIEQLKRGEAYVFGETLAFRNYADAMVRGNTLTL